MSTTAPNPGETITVTGSAFLANASVKLSLRSQSNHAQVFDLKTVRADPRGAFTTQIVVPEGTTNGGHYDLIATTGINTADGCTDPLQTLAIGSATAGGGNAGGAGGSGGAGTAFTGVNVLLMLLVAAGLIGAGVAVNRRAPSKRSHSGRR